MSAIFLHIVSFNVPYPPNYGGIIDIYYKLIALQQAGINIILHCFSYGRQPSKELEDICFKVYYYPRHSGIKYYLSSTPYIVNTRTANTMPERILGDSFPVLFEGLHSTDMLVKCKEAGKKVLFRAHNIEHLYYQYLANTEKNLFRKLFFKSESNKLKRYEAVLQYADEILGISKHETEYFNNKYGRALFIPAFHQSRSVQINEGTGTYILYHGNLSVPENIEAVRYLTKKIISKTICRFIIAGKDPSEKLIRWLKSYDHVEIVPNPDEEHLRSLINEAQINIFFTFQSTGLKLKLLHSLFNGRHCIVNPMMMKGTGLEDVCHVVSGPEQAVRMINHLMNTLFTEEDIAARKRSLSKYSVRENAEKIVRLLS